MSSNSLSVDDIDRESGVDGLNAVGDDGLNADIPNGSVLACCGLNDAAPNGSTAKNKHNSNITSFFCFVNKPAIYLDGKIALAHVKCTHLLFLKYCQNIIT